MLIVSKKKRNNRNNQRKTSRFNKKGGYFRIDDPADLNLNEKDKQEWEKWNTILQSCSKPPSETDAKKKEAREQLCDIGDSISCGISNLDYPEQWFDNIEDIIEQKWSWPYQEKSKYEIGLPYENMDFRYVRVFNDVKSYIYQIKNGFIPLDENRNTQILKSLLFNINSPKENDVLNNYINIFKNSVYDSFHEPKWWLDIIRFSHDKIILKNMKNQIFHIEIYGLELLRDFVKQPHSHLQNESYVKLFSQIFKIVLYSLGLCIKNMQPIVQWIVDIINQTAGYKFVIFDCKPKYMGEKKTDYKYTCGRAISLIGFQQKPDDTLKYRILVSNTISEDDDYADYDYQHSIKNRIENGTYPYEDYN